MATLQSQDPIKTQDLKPILKLRLQQTDQPQPEKILSESEVVKILWGQWHCLVVKNRILYRKLYPKNGRPPVLQLIVKRTEFIKSCHGGMTGEQ